MGYRTIEAPRSVAWTTVSRVKVELGIAEDDTTHDARLSAWIDELSEAMAGYCERTFARAHVEERAVGLDRSLLMVSLTPIAEVREVLDDGTVFSPHKYSIYEADVGTIYAQAGWPTTEASRQWITRQTVPGSAPALSYSINYLGGYLMPQDDLVASGTLAVQGGAFVSSEGDFPLLVSGELIRVAGFATAANNGRFTVQSRTGSTIIVAEALTDEAAPDTLVTLRCRNFPLELERCLLDELKELWLSRNRSSTLESKKIGDWAETYETYGTQSAEGVERTFTASVQNRLTRWTRIA
jgi:hypothetical protein